ncbi:FliM/FliN family flagellar motor switch protein [Planctomycetota bacterium]
MVQTAQVVEEKAAKKDENKKQVQSAEFSEAAENNSTGQGGSIDILLDMNVPITVTIGQTEIPVRRLLQLGPGAVLKLGKPIEEPVDLYLSDSRFATGSVVVVDNHFAIKINQIIDVKNSSQENNRE